MKNQLFPLGQQGPHDYKIREKNNFLEIPFGQRNIQKQKKGFKKC